MKLNPYEIVYGHSDKVQAVKEYVESVLYQRLEGKKRIEIGLDFGVPPEADQLGVAQMFPGRRSGNKIQVLKVTIRPGLQMHEVMGTYAHKIAVLLIDDIRVINDSTERVQAGNSLLYYQFAYDVVNAWHPEVAQKPRHLGMLQALKSRYWWV